MTTTVAPLPELDAEEQKKRRRRYILLAFLGALLLLLIIFLLWYLLFRKPISQIVPPLDLTNPPTYQASIYGLTKPLGVAVSPDGSRMYVTQTSGDQATLLLDSTGKPVAVLAPPAQQATHASQLYVAVDPRNGDVYATDRTAGAIYHYRADGTYVDVFDNGPTIDVWQPLAIAFDPTGTMYVSDVGGADQRIHVFGPDGAFVRDLGSEGLFSFPNGIAVDKAGFVYVSDSNNGRLLVFDPAGSQVALVRRGPAQGELGMPRGVAFDDTGRVYVVDSVGQGVHMYRPLQQGDQVPTFLARFGREGTTDGAFEFPNGIAVDGRGRVYVTDWNNDRLQVWSY
jgi:tripartite motif-containing protein 71